MKSNFTFLAFRYVTLTCVLAYLSLTLNGQTTHNVAVTNNVFTPSNLTITAGDKIIWTNSAGSHNVNGTKTSFASNPVGFGNSLGNGWTYEFTFNTSGTYNYQCDPHVDMGMVGKITVNPKPSTDPLTLTVNFTGMTPHVGQILWLAVIDQASKVEIGRVKKVAEVAFSLVIPGIEAGKSYNVDFYSDHNKNNVYNAPPTDHAWRMQLNNVTGNSVLNFAHNTTFSDIAWRNKLTVHFTGMTPHLGQKVTLFIRQTDNGIYRDTVIIPQVAGAIFDINSFKIKPGISYNIDFYSDHNKNGVYNAPPADHAWRIPLTNVRGDSIVNFVHNTTFTDIFAVTSNAPVSDGSGSLNVYPNPASSYLELRVPRGYQTISSVKIYSVTGAVVSEKVILKNQESFRFDVSQFRNGIYFIEISAGNHRNTLKFIKQ